jgi:hypothetical protein
MAQEFNISLVGTYTDKQKYRNRLATLQGYEKMPDDFTPDRYILDDIKFTIFHSERLTTEIHGLIGVNMNYDSLNHYVLIDLIEKTKLPHLPTVIYNNAYDVLNIKPTKYPQFYFGRSVLSQIQYFADLLNKPVKIAPIVAPTIAPIIAPIIAPTIAPMITTTYEKRDDCVIETTTTITTKVYKLL